MGQNSIPEYLKVQRTRYLRRPGNSARSILLNEACEITGLNRKHLIKVLKGTLPIRGEAAGAGRDGRGRPGSYGDILPVIKGLWLASEPLWCHLFKSQRTGTWTRTVPKRENRKVRRSEMDSNLTSVVMRIP